MTTAQTAISARPMTSAVALKTTLARARGLTALWRYLRGLAARARVVFNATALVIGLALIAVCAVVILVALLLHRFHA
jgi:hypothetical protein